MVKSFSSPFSPDEAVRKLKNFVDEEEIDGAHPERYAGHHSFIGQLQSDRFTIHRRLSRSWLLSWMTPAHWFKPFVYGTIKRDSTGSYIQLEGSQRLLVKVIWIALIAGAAGLIATGTVLGYPYTISHDPVHAASNLLIGITLFSLVTGVLIIIPVIGWFLTRNHLEEIEQELQRQLQLKEI